MRAATDRKSRRRRAWAVGFLCQRSVLGRATAPQRRARLRTTGVRQSARTNEAATGISWVSSKGSLKYKYRSDSLRLRT